MRCQEFREMMDSYIGDELLVETNHEFLRHLESCAACRAELAARRRLLAQMRSAIKAVPEMWINPDFAAALRNDLRRSALRPGVWEKLKHFKLNSSPVFAAIVAACLLVGIITAAWIRLNRPVDVSPDIALHERKNIEKIPDGVQPDDVNKPAGNAQIIRAAWREMTNLAVGDHKNCALHFNLDEKPITLIAASGKYGQFNRDLDKAVKAALERKNQAVTDSDDAIGKLEFLEAHSCVFNGHRFAHIVLRRGKETISLLVTDDDSLDETAEPLINQSEENFQVAGFRVRRHAVIVVSDLTESENSAVARMLLPAVRLHIEQAEV